MRFSPLKVLVGFYFYPRGGSSHACRAIATELGRNGLDVTLLAGSRTDIDGLGSAQSFFTGCDVHPVDFTPALRSEDPLRFVGGPGTAPMHASYEDRRNAEDPVFATLDDDDFELQVDAWATELELAGAADADVLYLHHLTPINEAAARVAPETPVIGHIHGSELLMLERIARAGGPPSDWPAAEQWAERLCDWAAGCGRIVVNSPTGLRRAAELLDLHPDRFLLVPNGFNREFAPHPVDAEAHWHRNLVERPLGWGPGEDPGSVTYEESELAAFGGTTLLNVGRFTEVKRVPMLIEAFANAAPRFDGPVALVLLGGFPGECEGEHPLDAIARTGAENVFLAGWHPHAALPDFMNASDVLVHASVNEQFGLVLVEAMACALPVIAVNRGGPADIVEDGETGWLLPPDDREALEDAMVAAVNGRAQLAVMGDAARAEAVRSYGWTQIGAQLADLVRECRQSRPLGSTDDRRGHARSPATRSGIV